MGICDSMMHLIMLHSISQSGITQNKKQKLLSLHSGSMHCGQGQVALNHVLIDSICLQPEESTATHQCEQGMAYGGVQAEAVGSTVSCKSIYLQAFNMET